MKPFVENMLWMAFGAILFLIPVLGILYYQKDQNPDRQLAQKSKRLEWVARMERDLISASELEKSAVLAITDPESRVICHASARRNRGSGPRARRTDGTFVREQHSERKRFARPICPGLRRITESGRRTALVGGPEHQHQGLQPGLRTGDRGGERNGRCTLARIATGDAQRVAPGCADARNRCLALDGFDPAAYRRRKRSGKWTNWKRRWRGKTKLCGIRWMHCPCIAGFGEQSRSQNRSGELCSFRRN